MNFDTNCFTWASGGAMGIIANRRPSLFQKGFPGSLGLADDLSVARLLRDGALCSCVLCVMRDT